MSKNEIGPIEEDILIEDTQAEETQKPKTGKIKIPQINPQQLLQKIQNFLISSPKQKFITLILLLGSIIVIYLGLLLISAKYPSSTKQETQPEQQPKTQTEEQRVLSELNQKIQDYSKRLNSLDHYRQKLTQPIVDLDISFN